jgi:hypothetical protein
MELEKLRREFDLERVEMAEKRRVWAAEREVNEGF